jgi:hypothetical protein
MLIEINLDVLLIVIHNFEQILKDLLMLKLDFIQNQKKNKINLFYRSIMVAKNKIIVFGYVFEMKVYVE